MQEAYSAASKMCNLKGTQRVPISVSFQHISQRAHTQANCPSSVARHISSLSPPTFLTSIYRGGNLISSHRPLTLGRRRVSNIALCSLGGKGSGKQPKGKRVVKNVEPVLVPQGKGTKRTPVSAFDPAQAQGCVRGGNVSHTVTHACM